MRTVTMERAAAAGACTRAALIDRIPQLFAPASEEHCWSLALTIVCEALGAGDAAALELVEANRLVVRSSSGAVTWRAGVFPVAPDSQAAFVRSAPDVVVVDDLLTEDRFVPPGALIDAGKRAAIGCCFSLDDGRAGVIGVYRDEPHAFDADDRDRFAQIVPVVGLAIRQARRNADLDQRARHDALTGLLNRSALFARLDELIERGTEAAAMLIDLDGFKALNDDHGHRVGDAVLAEVAQRPERSTRSRPASPRRCPPPADDTDTVLRTARPSGTVDRVAESGGLAIRGSEQVGAAVVAVGVLLVLILMSGPLALGDGVPATIRRQVDDNGEASMYAALMIVLLTEPLVSRAFVRRIWWTVVAIGLVATSSVGHWTGLSGWLMTLRESFAAAAIVAIYLSVPTRYRRRVSAYVAVVAMTVAVELSLVVIGHSGPALLMQEHAETVGMVLLTAVLVDVLEPRPATLGRPAPSWARIAWCGALVASVVVLLIVDPDEVLATAGASSSVSDQLLVWAARNLESLLGVLAVSIWLFALGTSRVAATSPAATTGISSASDPRPHTT